MRIWTLGIAVALVGCGSDSTISLDGKAICPPAQAMLDDVPWWLKSVKGLDTSYAEARLSIEPHRVLVTNETAIRGRSATQEELLKVAGSGGAKFEPIEGTAFYKVWARSEYPTLGWEVVRWLPKGDEGSSPQSLAQWIVSHCTLINNSQSCLVQRVHNGLAYEFYYGGPLSNLDEATRIINEHLDRWQAECGKEAQQAIPGDGLASLGRA